MRKSQVTRTFYSTRIFGSLVEIDEEGNTSIKELQPIDVVGDLSNSKAKMQRKINQKYGSMGAVLYTKCEVSSVLRSMSVEDFIEHSHIVEGQYETENKEENKGEE